MRPIQRGVDWWRAAATAAAILYLVRLAWRHTRTLLAAQPLGIDFLPMWAGARLALTAPSRIYDFARMTRLVRPYLGHWHGLRPFVYPPSTLLILSPFAIASFDAADVIWTALGLVLLVWTMAELVGWRRFLLLAAMVLSPASVLVILTGQTTYLIAALCVIGVVLLKHRPWVAGVLLGAAGAVKPQALVLLPVALLAIGQWRALLAAVLTAATAVAASAIVFGADLWAAWPSAVSHFEVFIMHAPALQRGMITPTGLCLWAGVAPDALGPLRFLFAAVAVVMAWTVFRATENPARRLAALLGGALFVSPYAMHYDATLLAPAAVLWLAEPSRPGRWLLAAVAGALLCCAAIPHWGALAVTLFTLLAAFGGEWTAPDALWDWVTWPVARLGRRVPAAPLALLIDQRQDHPTA